MNKLYLILLIFILTSCGEQRIKAIPAYKTVIYYADSRLPDTLLLEYHYSVRNIQTYKEAVPKLVIQDVEIYLNVVDVKVLDTIWGFKR